MDCVIRTGLMVFVMVHVLSAADYFPCVVGNKWNYKLSYMGTEETLHTKITEKTLINDNEIYRYELQVGGFDVVDTMYLISDENDVLVVESIDEEGPYQKVFAHQPVSGNTFTRAGIMYEIVYYGSITVAAGTFTECYATLMNGDISEIYAPDVGLVKDFSNESFGNELISFATTSAQLSPVSGEPFATRVTEPNRGADYSGYAVVNILGRRVPAPDIQNATMKRTVAPGLYFIRDDLARSIRIQGYFNYLFLK